MTDALVGHELGGCRIVSVLGKGGMAVVYKAYQSSLGRYVAIKVLPPSLARDQHFIERFQREATATARLDHPHIVQVIDAGYADGYHYIIMELLAGGSLADVLRSGALAPSRASAILSPVADALDHAHRAGIVHRDIKPSNILFTGDGRPVLSDFGIARLLQATSVTSTGLVIGTPEYISPEYIEGNPVGPRSDIYSLGIVLYQMLAGRVPFAGAAPTAILYAHVHKPPPPLSTFRSDIDPALEQVVQRALAKQPEKRYATAGEMARDLQRVLGQQATTPGPVPHSSQPARFIPVVMAGMLALLVLLFLAARGSETPQNTQGSSGTVGSPATLPAMRTPTVRQASLASSATSATATLTADRTLAAATTPSPPPHSTATPTVSGITTTGVIVNGGIPLRVRAGPSFGHMVIGQLDIGSAVKVLGRTQDNSWVQIQAANGCTAWAKSEYVRTVLPLDRTSVVASPPLPRSVRVANAAEDFSNQQGYRGWFYRTATPPGSLNLTEMPWDSSTGKWWRWCCNPTYNPNMRISDSGSYPSSNRDVVRMWLSPYDGSLRIWGRAYKETGAGLGGNGVRVSIMHNQTPVWTADLAPFDSRGKDFDYTIVSRPEDKIYFITSALGEDTADNTVFAPTIELQHASGITGLPQPQRCLDMKPTPQPTNTVPPPVVRCFAPRLRHFEPSKSGMAEMGGLVLDWNEQPMGPPGAIVRVMGPPATNRWSHDYGVDPVSGGYQVTALTVDVYTVSLVGPNVRSSELPVRYAHGPNLRAVIDFHQVPC